MLAPAPFDTHAPLPHCESPVQTSPSFPSVHFVPLQNVLRQSLPDARVLFVPQVAPHEPPQSTSVSSPSRTESAQCAATHAPWPLHTTPPASASSHVVPSIAL